MVAGKPAEPTARTAITTVAGKSADDIRAEIAALEKALRQAEESEQRAAQAGNAKRALALIAAMRAAYKEVEALFPGTFEGEKWIGAATAQAWPRPGRFKRLADLSETEVANATERGVKAVSVL